MMNSLDILATTTGSTTHPVAPMLIVYCIWCWRRTPPSGSTRALDGWWAGFLSANFCVVGFWMSTRGAQIREI